MNFRVLIITSAIAIALSSAAVAQQKGTTSGEATGNNVAPSTGENAGGAAGTPSKQGTEAGPQPDATLKATEGQSADTAQQKPCKSASAKMTNGTTESCK